MSIVNKYCSIELQKTSSLCFISRHNRWNCWTCKKEKKKISKPSGKYCSKFCNCISCTYKLLVIFEIHDDHFTFLQHLKTKVTFRRESWAWKSRARNMISRSLSFDTFCETYNKWINHNLTKIGGNQLIRFRRSK